MNKQLKLHKDGSVKSRGIEWTNATWNPVGGCLHACQWEMPDGAIANCYAEDVATRVAQKAYPQGFEHHYWNRHLLGEPLKAKGNLKIFVGSMADVFGHWVPVAQIEDVLDIVRQAHWHTFQFLTKNAVRAQEFHLPKNAWLGTSTPPTFMWNKRLTDDQQQRMMKRSLQALGSANAEGPLWISAEPLTFNLAPLLRQYPRLINWIVIGAASNGKQQFPPKQEFVEALYEEADRQNIKLFLKGNMKSLEWAASHWREEFPDPDSII